MSRGGLGLLIAGLVAAAAAGSVATSMLAQRVLVGFEPSVRLGLEAAMHAGVALLILTPVGIVAHRQLHRLCSNFTDAGADAGVGSVSAPFWLRPVSEAMLGAVRTWAGRCEAVNTRLREVEIRQRLSEAERDHASTILDSLRDAVKLLVKRITALAPQAAKLNKQTLRALRDEPPAALLTDAYRYAPSAEHRDGVAAGPYTPLTPPTNLPG